MKKIYILTEAQWDYGEVYSFFEFSGWKNIAAYSEQETAEKEKKRLSVAKLRGLYLNNYGSFRKIAATEYDRFCLLLTGNPKVEPLPTFKIPEDILEEKALEILECLDIEFYSIQELNVL